MTEMTEENLLNDMVEEEAEDTLPATQIKLDPRPGDENWEEFVLSKLTNREIDDNGHPSTAGLRRVAPSLLGKIINSGPINVFNPQQNNDHRATVIYELVYINKYYDPEDPTEEQIIKVREVADAWEANIDGDMFKKFPTAIASTRAEGRALRKALLLSVAVKEEISEEEYVPVSAVQDGPCTSVQKSTIKNLCGRRNINMDKLLEWGKDSCIDDVTKVKAANIIKFLNDNEKVAKAPKHIFLGG